MSWTGPGRLAATTASWRPPLRMAWRDLWSHRLRSVVVVVLVALPVAAAVAVSTVAATTAYESDNTLRLQRGTADLALDVTPWPSVRLDARDGDLYVGWTPTRSLDDDDRRLPLDVDVAALLPAGSTTTRTGTTTLSLTSGGSIYPEIVDLELPLSRDLAMLAQGSAPQEADEVGLSEAVADELGFLDAKGRLEPDAALTTEDGAVLRVVGITRTADSYGASGSIVAPTSELIGRGVGDDLRGDVDTTSYLVDLPPMSTEAQRRLVDDLADVGVAAWARDSRLHPEAWGLLRSPPEPVDLTTVAVGALVIGLGLVEVLVLVGSVFAVSARRQSRTLGLLIASGGTARDARRTVLAQGLWIGVIGAVLGIGGGAAVLVLAREPLGGLVGTPLVDYALSPGAIVALGLLGIGSAVLAAAIPAWGVGRMTASQALDGHVVTRTSKRRDRLAAPAAWLVGIGTLGLVACGFWISRSFADQVSTASGVPVVVAAIFALVLLTGTALGLPTAVTWSAGSSRRGWLPWRLATRDAARNRARTSAAVLAIGVVTTGAVFAGFGASAATAYGDGGYRSLPPDTAESYLSTQDLRDPARVERIKATLTDVLGADSVVMAREARLGGRLVTQRNRQGVLVVDDAWLDLWQVPGPARAALADGAALRTVSTSAQTRPRTQDRLQLRTRGSDRAVVADLDVVDVRLPWDGAGAAWISEATAAGLGLTAAPNGSLLAHAPGVTQEDTERLRLYGIYAEVDYLGTQVSERLVYAGAGATVLLTALVVGMIVALAAAEGRGTAATLASVGAPPWTRRAMSAAHALFVGGLGSGVGLLLGSAVGATTLQLIGTAGTPVPWGALGLLVVGVPLLCAAVGWVVTPTRLQLTRRTA